MYSIVGHEGDILFFHSTSFFFTIHEIPRERYFIFSITRIFMGAREVWDVNNGVVFVTLI
jgi:hypothetical protein